MRTLLNVCAIFALTVCSLASCAKENLDPIITPGVNSVAEMPAQPFVVSIYVDDEVGLESTTFSFFDEEGVSKLDETGISASITTRTVSSDQWANGVVDITIISDKVPAYLQTPNGEGDGIYTVTREAVKTKGNGADYVKVRLVR